MPAIDRYLSIRMRALLLIAGQVVAPIGPDLTRLANILTFPFKRDVSYAIYHLLHLIFNTIIQYNN